MIAVYIPSDRKSSPTVYKRKDYIEMETFAGMASEPLLDIDPKIFDDPKEHHIQDDIWTKSQPVRWGEHIKHSFTLSIVW